MLHNTLSKVLRSPRLERVFGHARQPTVAVYDFNLIVQYTQARHSYQPPSESSNNQKEEWNRRKDFERDDSLHPGTGVSYFQYALNPSFTDNCALGRDVE